MSQLMHSVYVLLELVKLRGQYISLTSRTRALKNKKPEVSAKEAEGYEMTAQTETAKSATSAADQVSEGKKLHKEWTTWSDNVLTNAYV
jgi:hypothetical protein